MPLMILVVMVIGVKMALMRIVDEGDGLMVVYVVLFLLVIMVVVIMLL